ncbi:Serine carboxypeptidase-like 31 [Hibiscus syriacus]|uniref:Carboxypeptidase n=1 Tax=Hibiscus syriacus TaxID=106335 RepID=A0A6A3BDP4_HIBSY|nr:Serine carboxypeptidase-like 31 [Hibiscus syriacus]
MGFRPSVVVYLLWSVFRLFRHRIESRLKDIGNGVTRRDRVPWGTMTILLPNCPAMSQPDEKPLVLWLNGGPGCSSVGYGATQEIGPFIVDTNGLEIKFNNFSWNKEANMLFLESPIGVGFSYSNSSNDYDNLGDEFTERTFYIAGESYAGKYVPELADLIYDNNKDPSLILNSMLGNPETYDAEDWRGMVDYAWSHAVVSDETHKTITETCDFKSNDTWSNEDCSEAVDEVLKQYKEIDMFSLYTPVCIDAKDFGRFCLDGYANAFYNRLDVQIALHVSDGHHLRNWSICNMDIFDGWADTKPSVLPIYQKLIAAGIRIWIYSGHTNGRVPVLSTRYSISALGLPSLRHGDHGTMRNRSAVGFKNTKGLRLQHLEELVMQCLASNQAVHSLSSLLFSMGNPHLLLDIEVVNLLISLQYLSAVEWTLNCCWFSCRQKHHGKTLL